MNKISTNPTQSEDFLDGDSAVYQELLIPQHMGNPLIEALPPEISDDEIYLLLRQQVACNDQLRSLPDKTRMILSI